MIKKRWNIKKEKLKEKLLNEQRGFIVGNALIILPLIFSLIIAIYKESKSANYIIKSTINRVDRNK